MNFEVVWTCALVLLHGVLCVELDVVSVSVTEGDPVTLHNNFTISKNDKIKWYFNSTRIAQIDVYSNKTCTDVQCNDGTERFRGRLKLDHQTGSLTIMNTTITDSGNYQLKIISTGDKEKNFILNVTVFDVSTKVPEGQTDTSNPDSGLSAGAVAGIVVGVLLLVCIVVAGVRYKIRTQHRPLRDRSSGVQESKTHYQELVRYCMLRI